MADLRLHHMLVYSLDGIGRLPATRRLTINWANKISGLTPDFQMHCLEFLDVGDFPQVRGIAGIENLERLTELHLAGNLGSLHPPMRLASAKPLLNCRTSRPSRS
jgi:hypothetical protein